MYVYNPNVMQIFDIGNDGGASDEKIVKMRYPKESDEDKRERLKRLQNAIRKERLRIKRRESDDDGDEEEDEEGAIGTMGGMTKMRTMKKRTIMIKI